MVSVVKLKHTLNRLQSEHDGWGRAGIQQSKLPSSSGMMTTRGKRQVCKHKQEQLANDPGRQRILWVTEVGK